MIVKDEPDLGVLASDLRVVLGRLIRRLRAEHTLSLSHGSVLGRLDRAGTASIGDLAVAERVRPQSMTQTIADLEADGLVARHPDPGDGRRMLIELTDSGIERLSEERARRDGWLARAIAEDLSPSERKLLARTLPLLERLSDVPT